MKSPKLSLSLRGATSSVSDVRDKDISDLSMDEALRLLAVLVREVRALREDLVALRSDLVPEKPDSSFEDTTVATGRSASKNNKTSAKRSRVVLKYAPLTSPSSAQNAEGRVSKRGSAPRRKKRWLHFVR